jgi:hypothetical protein
MKGSAEACRRLGESRQAAGQTLSTECIIVNTGHARDACISRSFLVAAERHFGS